MSINNYLLLLLSFSILLSALEITEVSNQTKKMLLISFCLILIQFAGFRDNIDRDYDTYIQIYEGIHKITEWTNFADYDQPIEWGYAVTNAIIKEVFDQHQPIFLLMALLTIVLYGVRFNEYTGYPLLSMFVLFSSIFILQIITQMRQGLSCAIIFFALKYLINRNRCAYFLSCVLASLFHFTGIFALILYPLYKIKWSFNKLKMVIFISLIVTLLKMDQIIYEFTNIFGLDFINLKYVAYMENDIYYFGSYTAYLKILIMLLVSMFIYDYAKKHTQFMAQPIDQLIFTMLVCLLFTRALFLDAGVFAIRASEPFYIVILILAPRIFQILFSFKNRLIMLLGVWLIGCFYFAYTNFLMEGALFLIE